MKRVRFVLPALAAVFSLPCLAASEARTPAAAGSSLSQARVMEAFARLPLRFERNDGQADPQVGFLARGQGYGLFVTSGEVVFSLHEPTERQPTGPEPRARKVSSGTEERVGRVLRMRFVDANPKPDMTGGDELLGKSNYFKGNDPKRWRTNVPQYERVVYRDLWKGIDLTFYGTTQGQLESDFTVSPGAVPSVIRLAFEGVREVRLDEEGHLVLEVGTGEVVQRRPLIYQEVSGERRVVSGAWALRGEGHVGFRVSDYDTTLPLIIDPVLEYSTFLGGSGYESGSGLAVDAAGNAYVTGSTYSTDFPTAGTPSQSTSAGGTDTFVTKLSPTSGLVYSTYLGGAGEDEGMGIAVDASGNAYVTGFTNSTDFPTAGTPSQPANAGSSDAFVVALSPTSSLVYSTYLGGTSWDFGQALDVDTAGNVHVVGDTDSTDFPTAGTPSQPAPGGFGDVFVTKLSPTSALVYSTYLGGLGFEWGRGLAVDAAGNAYVVGGTEAADFPTAGPPLQAALAGRGDAFISKLSPTSSLLYSTYLGGSLGDDCESGDGIAVDVAGDVYVTGFTCTTDFPTAGPPSQVALAGGWDAFVTRLSVTSGLVFSTYLGGSGDERGYGIAVDTTGSAHVTGWTDSTDFPTAGLPFQAASGGGRDAFVAKLSPTSGLAYSTYLGGLSSDSGSDIAVDPAGNAYVTGGTQSTNFPTAGTPSQPASAGGGDAFLAMFRSLGQPSDFYTVTPCRVADTRWAASPSGGPVLAADSTRNFPVTDLCGVPSTATGVAVNLTVVGANAAGHLRLYPAGSGRPGTSTINFTVGVTRANNAVIPIGSGGQIAVYCRMTLPLAQTHFVLDVVGYFE